MEIPTEAFSAMACVQVVYLPQPPIQIFQCKTLAADVLLAGIHVMTKKGWIFSLDLGTKFEPVIPGGWVGDRGQTVFLEPDQNAERKPSQGSLQWDSDRRVRVGLYNSEKQNPPCYN